MRFLVGRHNEHGDFRIIGRDPAYFVAARIAIAPVIKRNPHVIQALQSQRANNCASLTDASRENHGVESTHRGDISAYVFPNTIAVRLEREQSALMAIISGLENFAHVARNPGQAEQAAFLVQHFFAL
jgi:hypothetical protein